MIWDGVCKCSATGVLWSMIFLNHTLLQAQQFQLSENTGRQRARFNIRRPRIDVTLSTCTLLHNNKTLGLIHAEDYCKWPLVIDSKFTIANHFVMKTTCCWELFYFRSSYFCMNLQFLHGSVVYVRSTLHFYEQKVIFTKINTYVYNWLVFSGFDFCPIKELKWNIIVRLYFGGGNMSLEIRNSVHCNG